jgi:hypothetical protein
MVRLARDMTPVAHAIREARRRLLDALLAEALALADDRELEAADRMSINLVIAVTDGGRFDMLWGQPNLAEVNFWAPSAANFRALQPGELFLFKLHAPRNVIVGGGVFA